jgi:hypothetical protein
MSRWDKVCFAVLALAAAPASAATYTGTLNGIITSGAFDYFDELNYNPPLSYSTDLTGLPISIDFTADVKYNYVDGLGYLVPRYVFQSISVTVQDLDPNFSSVQARGGASSNDVNYIGLNVSKDDDFTGNASDGHLTVVPLSRGSEQGLDVIFDGASPNEGPLSGSGSALAVFAPPVNLSAGYDVKFRLTDGFVQMTGAPEPGGWTLMIVGLGVVGAAMRARHKHGAASTA